MTSTWTFQGLKEGSRNSSKVLKPPGGGSSNIFGSASEETSPRRTNNHNQSQLGSAIFGEDSPNSNNPEATRVNKPGGNPITGTGYSGDDAQNSETPVQTRNANENGVEKSNATSIIGIPAVQGRNRVPPGGYSSGLW